MAPITRPGVSSLPGMSFSECIAGMQLARGHRGADFGDEGAALAAMRQQLAGLVGIADGLELDDLDIELGRRGGQPPRDVLGLGKRHGALARADPHRNCHR